MVIKLPWPLIYLVNNENVNVMVAHVMVKGDMMNDDDGDDEDYGYWSDDDRYNVLHMASYGAIFDTIWDISVICIPAKIMKLIVAYKTFSILACIRINNNAWWKKIILQWNGCLFYWELYPAYRLVIKEVGILYIWPPF